MLQQVTDTHRMTAKVSLFSLQWVVDHPERCRVIDQFKRRFLCVGFGVCLFGTLSKANKKNRYR